ncbi:DUF1465 family protein [Sphingomonas sp. MMS24-JH45]
MPPDEPTTLHRRLIDTFYVEAMLLTDKARGYFDEGGRVERETLAPMTRVAFSCKSLKVTTRLMHVIAWLLTQRAVHAGELTTGQAMEPSRPLGRPRSPRRRCSTNCRSRRARWWRQASTCIAAFRASTMRRRWTCRGRARRDRCSTGWRRPSRFRARRPIRALAEAGAQLVPAAAAVLALELRLRKNGSRPSFNPPVPRSRGSAVPRAPASLRQSGQQLVAGDRIVAYPNAGRIVDRVRHRRARAGDAEFADTLAWIGLAWPSRSSRKWTYPAAARRRSPASDIRPCRG